MKKVAWIVSHPIQYYSPMYREIAKSNEIDLMVYYFSDFSVKGYMDKEFGKEVKWDIPLLDGYKYQFLKNFPLTKKHGSFFSYINIALFQSIKQNNYDLVIIHGWNTLSHFIAIFTCIVTNTPYALRGDTNAMDIHNSLTYKQKIRNKLLAYFFKKASVLFYVGEQNKNFYSSFGIKTLNLIKMPFAVDNEFFQSQPIDIMSEKESLGIKTTQKIILFTGKLIRKKQADLLIKALKGMENYILLIVGDGALHRELEEMAKNLKINFKFLGFINQKDMPKYYWISDIYVMPSIEEPWGLAINEAMNCKCAILASDRVGASDDLVKSNGFIFKHDSVSDLQNKLTILLNNDIELNKKKLSSFKLIGEYSFENDLNAIKRYFSTNAI